MKNQCKKLVEELCEERKRREMVEEELQKTNETVRITKTTNLSPILSKKTHYLYKPQFLLNSA